MRDQDQGEEVCGEEEVEGVVEDWVGLGEAWGGRWLEGGGILVSCSWDCLRSRSVAMKVDSRAMRLINAS